MKLSKESTENTEFWKGNIPIILQFLFLARKITLIYWKIINFLETFSENNPFA